MSKLEDRQSHQEHQESRQDSHQDSHQQQWQQGQLLDLTISDLNHDGSGVGRWQGRVIFVPDTVPGDRLWVRLLRVKPTYAYGKLHEIIEPSEHRVRPGCIVADKCGGCQWQQIDYAYQLEAKRNLVIQDLERIGGFVQPPVNPVLAVSSALDYRNKATYPVQVSITSGKSPQAQRRTVQAGYFQKGSHHLINLNQCPIQDQRLNPFLAEIKRDIQAIGWSIYDETTHRGEIRHLGLRIGRRTGEVLLTIVARTGKLTNLNEQAQTWLDRYPDLKGVCLNVNPDRTNAIFGSETRCIAGEDFITEILADLQFRIQPTTFFQVNTEQAEALLQFIQRQLNFQGTEILVDAYCGIGTLTLPLARQVRQAIGIELQPEAIEQANANAALNQITNATFHIGKTEAILPQLDISPDVVLLDPPRKGCEASVIETLLQMQPDRIVYVSCNPSTLARDLKLLSSQYELTQVQPADFFPQTAHVEAAAFLKKLTPSPSPAS
ncbi:23S rRNA (uracil(1939)-C(5))-methyltransferase RlmD [Leptolyngbya ohadii]|uniref:23S rRNA (uracil(1939)-C(5))-methyltransferase RlmD n=1 Tax=Leptolyngbya ohadii TaxID=1962290 RepID=UPI000B5A1255|nr:23S rRNA (uracil(1939)-C(5))-methyltransferase RlmD [Leptolyngbya ohadii]